MPWLGLIVRGFVIITGIAAVTPQLSQIRIGFEPMIMTVTGKPPHEK
jgi:hypothetical protein